MEAFDRIVIPTDGSDHAGLAVRKALSLAQLLRRPVLGLYVLDLAVAEPYPGEGWILDLQGILQKEAEKVLDAFSRRAGEAGIETETRILTGNPPEEIVRAARASDLIVIATHGRRGIPRLLLGSVAENVVRHAPCPVLVVRDGGGR